MSDVYLMLGPEGYGSYEVNWSAGTSERVQRSTTRMLIPGFVDIHIHGGFGIDFMDATAEDMIALCEKLAHVGYEGFLPTTITASATNVKRALTKLPEHEMVLGFHLEGPFISPKFPGAQPKSAIASPPIGESEWDEVFDDPRLKVITLAPEVPGALELTLRLMKRGVIVSMGHSNATYDEARHGFEFGAAHATHMFNAMRPFHHREAGIVGYALVNDTLRTELIYDRLHVCKQAASLLIKSKPHERLIAISDGSRAIGLPPGTTVNMWGIQSVVGRGEVRLPDGTLAGSSITLLDAFRNLHEDFGPELAIQACCLNPRQALQLPPPKVYVEINRALEITQIHRRPSPV